MIQHRAFVIFIAILAIIGTSAGDCTTGSDTHPNAPQAPGPDRGGPPAQNPGQPNPREGDPTPHRKVTVRAGEVEAAFLPATIEIHASPVGFQHSDIMTTSNSQGWSFEVPIGITVTVYAQLKPARAGSKSGWCSIESERLKDGPRIINGAWTASCTLVIPA